MSQSEHWVESFFGELYWEIFMKRNQDQILLEANIIRDVLGYEPKSVLDVCSGVGDILNELSRDGSVKTMGVEWSEDYVKNRYIDTVIKADACEKYTDEKFDLVLNWFSSFAYFDKNQNKKMLQHCYDATENVFILEYFNSYNILMKFMPIMAYEKELDGVVWKISRISKIDFENRKLNQKWVFLSEKQKFEHNTEVMLYFPDEIVSLLKDVGFSIVEVISNDVDGLKEIHEKSTRLIFKAYK